MPFTFEAIEARREADELVIRGRVTGGAYFGPEPVMLSTVDGRQHPSHIHAHEIEFPEAWPVLPEHRKTVLILRIPAPPPEIIITLVTGLGAVVPATRRVDVSDVLTQREFWAMQLNLHFESEEVEDPGLEWLGVPSEAAEEWYETRIQNHILGGVWPYVQVALPFSRYIELEMAGGAEYQDRIWVGDRSADRRVLLGYHSGHFSLPALRVEEVRWLAAMTHANASNLLWLAMAYLKEGADWVPLATSLASRVPGLLPDKAGAMAESMLRNLAVENLKWVQDPALGWINNWPYSQRNPNSRLSILNQADFAYIQQFFS